jgi:hypothetical protein
MSLLESKRGIEEAESVSRLTELAFLFIPTTFAASLFSMQVRELAENPPPVYAFIITAVVTVSVSYMLRLVQRSTLIGGLMRRTAFKIRTEKQVTSRDIPTRVVLSWLASKLQGRPLIIAGSCCALVLVLTPLWTKAAMDMSFKAALSGLTVMFMLLVMFWVIDIVPSPDGRTASEGPTLSIAGFGPVLRSRSRPRPRSQAHTTDSLQDTTSTVSV